LRKVAFHTLGCKLNFSETSTIARLFEQRGFTRVEFDDAPDVYVINTCSVTDNADKECRQLIRKAKKISPNSFVTIIGCYAQLKPNEIARIEGVDAVLGAAEKFRLFELLNDFVRTDTALVCSSEISQAKNFENAYSVGDRTRAFLKVQDGCDYHCSFCTIPLARGNSRSDSIENILRSAQKIADSGTQEIVITGVNTGDFGLVEGERQHHFIDLLRELEKTQGIERFRISSIEPNLLTNEIIELTANSAKFMPHFHIPLQSGSNKILQKMRRKYKKELYEERVLSLKKIMPDCCIGVDVIVGFPGETDEFFEETYNFLHQADISYLHVFTYSERENTKAAEMEGNVPVAIRKQRTQILRNLSEKKKNHFYATQFGKVRPVLFENEVKNGKIEGFSDNYVRVALPYAPELAGKTLQVLITPENVI
jgi:threonylcarbamoyladenosine tRNA methylthiotransferase MtaB